MIFSLELFALWAETFPDLKRAFDLLCRGFKAEALLMWPEKLALQHLMYSNGCRGRWAVLGTMALTVGEANRSWKGDGTFGCHLLVEESWTLGPFWSLIHAGCGKCADAEITRTSTQTRLLWNKSAHSQLCGGPGLLDGFHSDRTTGQKWKQPKPGSKQSPSPPQLKTTTKQGAA